MFRTTAELILASASPRRSELLTRLGVEFSVDPPVVDETVLPGEAPAAYVERMALSKAEQVSLRHGSSWVVAADTIVIIDNTILLKPASSKEAVDMLMTLAGREHTVQTWFCLCCRAERVSAGGGVVTAVRFGSFDRAWAEAYAATGEPMDKAGAYGIQGIGGVLVEKIGGSYSNVVGLPLAELLAELVRYRVVAPDSGHRAGVEGPEKHGDKTI